MNAVVTGGRDYVLTQADYQFLEHAVRMLGVKEILTGGTRGVDAQAEAWAHRRGIPVRRMPANLRRDGNAAITNSNARLAEAADTVIAFPGGEGTTDMVAQARLRKLPVFESPGRQLANLPTMDSRFRHLQAPPHHRPKLTP